MTRLKTKIGCRGFSMVEITVTLALVAILTSVFIIMLSGTKGGDKIDRGAQSIHDDLVLIRSRAVSTNQKHRLNFISTSEWYVETFNEAAGPPAWEVVGAKRQMPSDTYLTSAAFANAGNNVEATPRGIFEFLNSATGTPFVTVEGFGVARTKSINVSVGGALEFELN